MEQVSYLFYLVAFPAILLIGISKTGFLKGSTYIAIPALALIASPIFVIGITLPILLIMDFYGVIVFRQNYKWSLYFKLLPAAIVGVFIGLFTIHYITEDQIRIIIGVICITYALSYFFGSSNPAVPNVIVRHLLAVCGGFSSSLVHSGSPSLHKAIKGQKLDSAQIASTTVVFFATINLVKLWPYLQMDIVNSDTLHMAMILLPLAPIGMYISGHCIDYSPKTNWLRISHVCSVFIGTALIAQGIMGLSNI